MMPFGRRLHATPPLSDTGRTLIAALTVDPGLLVQPTFSVPQMVGDSSPRYSDYFAQRPSKMSQGAQGRRHGDPVSGTLPR